MIKLAVDAMGGDNGSSIVCEAILNYLKDNDDVEFHVVGKLEELKSLEGKAILYHADDVMGMEDGALTNLLVMVFVMGLFHAVQQELF